MIERLALILNKIKSIVNRFAPHPIRQIIKKIYYPFVIKNFKESDWPYTKIVYSLVRTDDLVLDIGANIGYITVWLAGLVGDRGRVYSFEPIPETYKYLEHNVRKLRYNNIITFQCAASSQSGDAVMEIPQDMSGSENFYQSRIVDVNGNRGGRRVVTVSKCRADDIFKDNMESISFIKIDVEGHELDVIQGAEGLISRSKPSMLIEVGGDPDLEGGAARLLFDTLQKNGYDSCIMKNGVLQRRNTGDTAVDYFFLTGEHVIKLKENGLL
jgi:FkbM family methyltransferase